MTEIEQPALPPIDDRGHAKAVDLADRSSVSRTAVAEGRVVVGADALQLIRDKQVEKGDVLTVAQVAGIMGAKRTSQLLPYCNDVVLQNVDIEFELNDEIQSIDIKAIAQTRGATGVEMEAVTAVTIASLTIYDMCKSIAPNIFVTNIRLLAKTGGQSGDFIRRD